MCNRPFSIIYRVGYKNDYPVFRTEEGKEMTEEEFNEYYKAEIAKGNDVVMMSSSGKEENKLCAIFTTM